MHTVGIHAVGFLSTALFDLLKDIKDDSLSPNVACSIKTFLVNSESPSALFLIALPSALTVSHVLAVMALWVTDIFEFAR
jgi:hypothetical protein